MSFAIRTRKQIIDGKDARPSQLEKRHPSFTPANVWTNVMDQDDPVDYTGMRHSIRPRRGRDGQDDFDLIDVHIGDDVPVASNLPTKVSRQEPAIGWDDLDLIEAGPRDGKDTSLPVVDADRNSDSVRAFDLLRTRLRQTTQEHGWKNIAIASPTQGCGSTFTAVNLALSLSRIAESRTVLMDFSLRNPQVANMLNIPAPGPMRDYLTGQAEIDEHLVKLSDTLALGLSDEPDHDASEILQAQQTSLTLKELHRSLEPELVLYDMPAMLTHDDVSAILPHLDGVLLVSDGTQTMGKQLAECERMLEGTVPLLGVVLNKARKDSISKYK